MQCVERLQRKLAAQFHPAHTAPAHWVAWRKEAGLRWRVGLVREICACKASYLCSKKCELPVLFLIEQNPFLISEIGPENLKNSSPAPDFRPGDAFQRLWKGFLEVFWLFLNAQKWIKSIYKLR